MVAAAGDWKRQAPDPDPPRGPLQPEVTGAPGEVTDRSRRHSLDRLWFRCRRCRVVRLGVTRQSLIKVWIAERLERNGSTAA